MAGMPASPRCGVWRHAFRATGITAYCLMATCWRAIGACSRFCTHLLMQRLPEHERHWVPHDVLIIRDLAVPIFLPYD